MMDTNVDLLQWFINFFVNKSSGEAIKNEIMSNKEQENYTNQLLGNLRKKSALIFYREYLGH